MMKMSTENKINAEQLCVCVWGGGGGGLVYIIWISFLQ